jgi:hypothetical protein
MEGKGFRYACSGLAGLVRGRGLRRGWGWGWVYQVGYLTYRHGCAARERGVGRRQGEAT